MTERLIFIDDIPAKVKQPEQLTLFELDEDECA